jgi:hypothetical protein
MWLPGSLIRFGEHAAFFYFGYSFYHDNDRAAKEPISAQTALRDLLNHELTARYKSLRGLISYGISCGRLGPDAQMLRDSLDDFLQATSDGDRQAASLAVSLCLEHGTLGGKADDAGADTEILRQFEAITDDEQRSAFCNKHRDELMKAQDARQNNES